MSRRTSANRAVLFAGIAALWLAAGCSDGGGGDTVTVLAPNRFEAVLTDLVRAFEAREDDSTVELRLDRSLDLARQLREGGDGDVYIAADDDHMAVVVKDGLAAGEPAPLGEDVLEIKVGAGNPHDISGLEDLAAADLRVGLCDDGPPCGEATQQVLERAAVDVEADTVSRDYAKLLDDVDQGALDATIVFRTDAEGRSDAVFGGDTVDIPAADNVVQSLSIVALKEAEDADLAERFVAFVRSEEGGRIIASFGYLGA